MNLYYSVTPVFHACLFCLIFQGFRVLVEKEWLSFGHKFADRCGLARCTDDTNERCPVFLQWLDAVHQLLLQFPRAFQFNECFLVRGCDLLRSGRKWAGRAQKRGGEH